MTASGGLNGLDGGLAAGVAAVDADEHALEDLCADSLLG